MQETATRFGRREFLGMAACAAAGCAVTKPSGRYDESLTVFFSDAHVSGLAAPKAKFTPRRLSSLVDEVLAMRPLPRRVVHLGDLAYKHGVPEDYSVAVPILRRLQAAGIELVFCMGNHDRRHAFSRAWPGLLEKSPVPGRFVSVTSLGTADLVVLDGLLGADDRLPDDMGPLSGGIFADQFEWMKRELPSRRRPFLVASHFPLDDIQFVDGPKENLGRWLLENAPMCIGYLHGHSHRWIPSWIHGPWNKRSTLRTLCIPSGGMWGDIGYVVMRTYGDRAVCRLAMRDFYFPCEPDDPNDRKSSWRLMVEELDGSRCSFPYGGNRA